MTCSQIVKLKFPKAPLHLLIFPIPFSDRELAKLVNVATTRGQIFQESSHFLNPPHTQKKIWGVSDFNECIYLHDMTKERNCALIET